MTITQKHWATIRITGYTPAEYLLIKDAAIQSECRVLFEKRTIVIAAMTSLVAIKQLEVFKKQLSQTN